MLKSCFTEIYRFSVLSKKENKYLYIEYYRDKAINEDSIMKKKIETEIQSLATDLLHIKDSRSTQEWKEITLQLYEKLCVLDYLESQLGVSQEMSKPWSLDIAKHTIKKMGSEEESTLDFEGKLEFVKSEETEIDPVTNPSKQTATLSFEENLETATTEEVEITPETNPITEVEKVTSEVTHTTVEISSEKTVAQQPRKRESDELQRFASTYKTPVFGRKKASDDIDENKNSAQAAKKPKSINDSLNRGLHIGLNDRIAFINHLFSGSTQDFNRVLSQINTMDDFNSVQSFLEEQIKPDYRNWEGKEEYSERFTMIIEKKFS